MSSSWIWQLLAFIVAISVLVAVHEFGHYWVARRLGFKVLRFSIGFGKPLWKRIGGQDRTEYVIAAIPLGGYVKLLDEREGPVPAAELPRSFTRRPVWQRLLVLLAGPGFNFLFAILAYWALFMWGVPQTRPVIGEVQVGSYAARADLRPGDEVLAMDGQPTPDTKSAVFGLLESVLEDGRVAMRVRSEDGRERNLLLTVASPSERHRLTEPGVLLRGLGFDFDLGPTQVVLGDVFSDTPARRAGLQRDDRVVAVDGREPRNGAELVEYIQRHAGERIVLTIERDDARLMVPVDVRADREGEQVIGRIGVEILGELRRPAIERAGPVAALGRSFVETWQMSALTVNMLWNMVMGRVSVKNISGPINIAAFAGETARGGLRPFLNFLAIVSISLGILNLLPIPILDGGQMLFQVIEWLKGSPLSERAQLLGQQVGIALLLLLMSLAFYNDISSRFLN